MRFKDVIGQKEIKQQLIKEVQQEKVSHAQLFLGKLGHGGLPLSLAFVQYLFCESKKKEDSCGECSSCLKIQELQHPDVHFSFPTPLAVSKTSDGLLELWREQLKEQPYFSFNDWIDRADEKGRKPIIGVEESKGIMQKLSLKSYEGNYKVMLIWKAETMNREAANKLLKLLEEPPKKTLFILISESQDTLLQTILSRTQILTIPRIDTDALREQLKNKGKGQVSADSIISRADGDLCAAQELINQGEKSSENRALFIELMRVCYKKDVLKMLHWADKVATTSRERQKVFLEYCLHMFRQSLLHNYTEKVLVRASKEEEEFLDKFARFITGNNIREFTETFNNGHYYIERNANAKLLFTNVCFKVMRYIHFA